MKLTVIPVIVGVFETIPRHLENRLDEIQKVLETQAD